MVANRFPDNPVVAISTEAQVRLTPPPEQGYAFKSSDPLLLLLCSGESTTTLISPLHPKFADNSFQHRLRSLALALQTAGVDASVSANFNQFQWYQVIPLLAFQPLSVILESNTPKSLVNNVLSKPLFSGIIAELMALAAKHSDCKFSSDYMTTTISNFVESYNPPLPVPRPATFTTSSSPQSSSSSSSSLTYSTSNPAYSESPWLFYNYFHSLPIYADLLLLQPILLADDFGIKTPYLESAFAFLSQLVMLNSPNTSVFLSRNSDKKKVSEGYLSDDLADRVKAMDMKEKALIDRENMLNSREQKLGQWRSSLQRLSQQQQPPMPPQHMQQRPGYAPSYAGSVYAGSTYNGSNGFANQRPMSQVPAPRAAPPPVENPELLDMMQMTTRKNRRSIGGVGGRNMRSSTSSSSLATMGGYNSRTTSMSQYPNPALNGGPMPMPMGRPNGGRMSVNESMIMEATGMDSLGSLTSNRYGTVDSSSLAKSRSNSMTMDSLGIRNGTSVSSPALFRDHFAAHVNDQNVPPPRSRQGSVVGSDNLNGSYTNGAYPNGNGNMNGSAFRGPPRGPGRGYSPPKGIPQQQPPQQQQQQPRGEYVTSPGGVGSEDPLFSDASASPYANGGTAPAASGYEPYGNGAVNGSARGPRSNGYTTVAPSAAT